MLTIEQFRTWYPLKGCPQLLFPSYNNFAFHWIDKSSPFSMRNTERMVRFQTEQQQLDAYLCQAVPPAMRSPSRDAIKQIEPGLYEAYRVLSGYGYPDNELFGIATAL